MRKNNRGFIATAVLYSLVILIAIILFLILKNLATQRSIEKDTANNIKNQLLYYEIIFDGNGNTSGSMENVKMAVGKTTKLPKNQFEKIGYGFIGWAETKDGEKKYEDEAAVKNLAPVREYITLYALYSPQAYKITFNPTGGTLEQTEKTVTYDSTYGTLPVPSKTGYTFSGWYTEENGGLKIENTTKVTTSRDQTLYAHWEANNYIVTLDTNGGTVSPSSIIVTYDKTYESLPTPTKTGYVFDGWYTAASGGELIENTTIVKIIENQTLYAHWTKPSHTVTYNYSYNGGTSASTVSTTVTEGEAIDLTPTATKSGYTFLGWNTTASATSKLSSLTMGTSNVTLYAIYYKTLTITLWDYSGTSRGARYLYPVLWNKSTASTKVTLPALRTATNECGNYSSQGWSTSSSATASTNYSANGSYSFSANTTLYARYNHTRTLVIDDNAGTSANASQINTYYLNGSGARTVINRYGSTISTAPWSYTFVDNCTRSGKTFVGWNGKYYKGSTITWSCDVMYSAYWR